MDHAQMKTNTALATTVGHLCRWDKDECQNCPLVTQCGTKPALPNGGGRITYLRAPSISEDGFAAKHLEEIKSSDFQDVAKRTYDTFTVGENSSNKLKRGIAWGTYVNDSFHWHDRDTYQLSAKLNPEENGHVRTFVRSGQDFLHHPALESALRKVFSEWGFSATSFQRAYEIQLGQIRYEPTITEPALPSPMIPHQDQIDGAIVVLRKEGDLVGGLSRLYALDDTPLFELDMGVGDALFVKDHMLKHQVTPLMLEPSASWSVGDRAYRDVLLVRFQPIGRYAGE